MRYVFLTAYKVLGIVHRSEDPDAVLFEGDSPETRVTITRQLDRRWAVLDRQSALAFMLLRGMVGQPLAESFQDELIRQVEVVRRTRVASLGNDGVLIVEIRGDIDAVVKDPFREIDDFILCFDAVDKGGLLAQLTPRVSAILAALISGSGRSYQFERIAAGSYLLNTDGRVIHSFSFEGGTARAYGSSPLQPEQIVRVRDDIDLILRHNELSRAVRLFVQSLHTSRDDFRSFVSAWSALEIMIGKIFPSYHAQLLAEFAKISAAPGLTQFLRRTADVMKGKQTLVDRFAVVSIFLDDQQESGDIDRFRKIKKIRDRLAHGEEVPEASLPNLELQSLFEKYFRRHLRRGA